MKKHYLLFIGLVVLVIAGCASRSDISRSGDLPAAVPAPAPPLLVISAVYGSGVKFADVTCRVDQLLHQPDSEFFARPEWLNADPTPGWNKALIITYEYKDRRHTFTTGEGGKVNLQLLIRQARKKPKRNGG